MNFFSTAKNQHSVVVSNNSSNIPIHVIEFNKNTSSSQNISLQRHTKIILQVTDLSPGKVHGVFIFGPTHKAVVAKFNSKTGSGILHAYQCEFTIQLTDPCEHILIRDAIAKPLVIRSVNSVMKVSVGMSVTNQISTIVVVEFSLAFKPVWKIIPTSNLTGLIESPSMIIPDHVKFISLFTSLRHDWRSHE